MRYLLLVFVLLFIGCSTKTYQSSDPKLITIKTKKFRYSDLGYLKRSGDAVSIELFSAGQMIQKIEINHLVCVQEGCMSKSRFNQEFLDKSYPDEILKNIILKKPIFHKNEYREINTGFKQKIQDNNVDIIYKVTPKSVYFKDKKNHILFKMKDIN